MPKKWARILPVSAPFQPNSTRIRPGSSNVYRIGYDLGKHRPAFRVAQASLRKAKRATQNGVSAQYQYTNLTLPVQCLNNAHMANTVRIQRKSIIHAEQAHREHISSTRLKRCQCSTCPIRAHTTPMRLGLRPSSLRFPNAPHLPTPHHPHATPGHSCGQYRLQRRHAAPICDTARRDICGQPPPATAGNNERNLSTHGMISSGRRAETSTRVCIAGAPSTSSSGPAPSRRSDTVRRKSLG